MHPYSLDHAIPRRLSPRECARALYLDHVNSFTFFSPVHTCVTQALHCIPNMDFYLLFNARDPPAPLMHAIDGLALLYATLSISAKTFPNDTLAFFFPARVRRGSTIGS